ncbi:hypothetical protein Q4494_00840 [Celeribacter halophilus]|uniref:Uncharacterized protein n=1 Tax=Celeribacter halophilus TaxID=576117 RepID=A0AAW7XMT3_9RHOB|nr:hypothetical protein [Celeribacter halophilus]MDO6455609.1 hypothetical protein [Celeribacter halophilus]
MKKVIIALILATMTACPASAFINPRTTVFIVPEKGRPGYGILKISVVGGAWKCVGRVRYPEQRLVAQNLTMECKGWVKSATATIVPDGEFFFRMDYQLSNGIKGHAEIS